VQVNKANHDANLKFKDINAKIQDMNAKIQDMDAQIAHKFDGMDAKMNQIMSLLNKR